MGRNIIRGVVFWGISVVASSALAQTSTGNIPRVCLTTTDPSITLLNDPTSIVVQRNTSSTPADDYCVGAIDPLVLSIFNSRAGSARGGFVINPPESFSSSSLNDANILQTIPLQSIPPNIEGKVWIVDARERSSGGWNVQCKSIEIARQKNFQAQLTQCTETSGILEVFPASVFQNVNIRFSLIGFSGSTIINQDLNRNLIASQPISLKEGASISTANLQVNTQYLTSDSRAHTCPLQQVRVQILTTQQAPRLVELDRRANENEVKLTVGNINPNLSFSVDRGPVTGGRQQVLANVKGPSVTVPMGAGMEDACFSVSIDGICPSTPRITSNVLCSSKLTGKLLPTASGDAEAIFQWSRPTQNPPVIDQMGRRSDNVTFSISSAATQTKQFVNCSINQFEFTVTQTLLESGFEVVVHTNTLDLDPRKTLFVPSEKLVVSMSETASPEVVVRLSDLISSNAGLNLYIEQKTGTGAFQPINPPDPTDFTLDVSSNPSGAHCFRFGRSICGVKSPPSSEFCVIQNELLDDFMLKWTAFTGHPEALEPIYYIQYSNKADDPTFSRPKVLIPTQDLTASVRKMFSNEPTWSQFLVRVFTQQTAVSGGISYSFPVEVFRPLALYLPTAFTPNGDGENDFFKIANAFSGTGFIRIYNRLGQIIYYTEDLSVGWDGTTDSGVKLPTGMYQFEVQVTNTMGQVWKRVGSVFLVR